MANWSKKKVEECFTLIKNGANIRQEKNAGGVPITRIETLSGGVFNRDRLGYANIETTEKYSSYILESGDLLFSHINSKAYIGRTVLYEKEGNEVIIHGMNLLRLKVNPSIVFPKYIYYSFQSESFRNQIASYRKDAVNQSSISVSDLKKVEIPVPSLADQQRIVAELDLLSDIVKKKNSQLKTLDDLAQSIFHETFGNPVTNERNWTTQKMKNVAPQKSFCGQIPEYKGKYWLLNLDMVESQTGTILEKVLFESAEIGNSTTTFDEQNVLYSKLRPYLNKVVIPMEPGYCTSELVPLRPQKNVLDRIFFAYLLRNPYFVEYINSRVAGAKMPRVNMTDFREFEVILPPYEFQRQFASKIDAITHQKDDIKASINLAEDLFNSRMDSFFND